MIMKYFDEKTQNNSAQPAEASLPHWVSKTNASFNAWVFTEKMKNERIFYIRSHHKLADFQSKLHYQIKPSEVAKGINVTRTTLMHTSTYSASFSKYIIAINKELEDIKEQKIAKIKKSPSRGSIRSGKAELLNANIELRKKLHEVEQRKIEELVHFAFDQLPLPVKKKLGID